MDKVFVLKRATWLVYQIERNGLSLGRALLNAPLAEKSGRPSSKKPETLDRQEVEFNDHRLDAWVIHAVHGGEEDQRLYLATGVGVVVQFRHSVCTPTHFWIPNPQHRGTGYGLRTYGDLSLRELATVEGKISVLNRAQSRSAIEEKNAPNTVKKAAEVTTPQDGSYMDLNELKQANRRRATTAERLTLESLTAFENIPDTIG